MEEVRVIEEKEKEELAKKAEAGLLASEPVVPVEPAVEAEVIEEEVMSKIQAEEDEAKKREGNVE
jgi:hypothetical protein